MLRFLPNARSDARTGPEWPEYEPWKSGAVASDGQRQASQAHGHSPVPGARERIPLDRVVKPGPGLSRSIWVFLARAGMFTFSLASGHLHPSSSLPSPKRIGRRVRRPWVSFHRPFLLAGPWHHLLTANRRRAPNCRVPSLNPPARVRSGWRTERAQAGSHGFPLISRAKSLIGAVTSLRTTGDYLPLILPMMVRLGFF